MARVKAGPLVSGIRGSVGPVTYYEMLGKQIVRARVRPHQKISSARYANRLSWKKLMAYWRNHRNEHVEAFRPWALAHGMHAVNAWLHVNAPWTWPLKSLAVQDLSAQSPFSVHRHHGSPLYQFHVTWTPAAVFWQAYLWCWAINEDPTLNYGPWPHYYNDGSTVFNSNALDTGYLHIYFAGWGLETTVQYFRKRIADIPFDPP